MSGIDDINARIASSLKMRVVVLVDVNTVEEDDDSGEQHSGHGVQPANIHHVEEELYAEDIS